MKAFDCDLTKKPLVELFSLQQRNHDISCIRLTTSLQNLLIIYLRSKQYKQVLSFKNRYNLYFLRLSNFHNDFMLANAPLGDPQSLIDYKIYHSQIPSNHPNYANYTMFQYKTKEMFFYKLMHLPPTQTKLIQYLYIKRSQIYQEIEQLKNNKLSLPCRFFTNRLNLFVEAKTQLEKSIIKIKQPYLRGINLAQIIVEMNHSRDKQEKEMHSFLQNLIRQLINLFIRVKKQALFIPTFRTIIFDKARNEFNLNLFSFVGTAIKSKSAAIEQAELRQILPFLHQSIFKQQQNWINLPRALAVIILGVMCGKEINLLTTRDGHMPIRNKQELKQLLKRSSQKYKKMLFSKIIMTKLSTFQMESRLTIKQFMYRVLVDEQMMSWSDCVQLIYKSNQSNLKQTVSQKQSQKIDNYIQNTAKRVWNNMKEDEKMYYTYNNILTLTNPHEPLQNQDDYQMLLIVSNKLNYNLINIHGGFNKLIHQTHHKQSSTFNSNLTHNMLSVLNPSQDKRGYDILSYIWQSNPVQCSYADISIIPCLSKTNEYIDFRRNQLQSSNMSTNQSQNGYQPQSKKSQEQALEQKQKQEDGHIHQNLQLLVYEQQVHKFMHQKSMVRLESRWLKTLRDYEKIIID